MDESTKRALVALEDEAAWADNLARCLVEAARGEPTPVVARFEHTIGQLLARIDALAHALRDDPFQAGGRAGTAQAGGASGLH